MPNLFPPKGEQDTERFLALKESERDYLWFSLDFCGRVLALRPSHFEALEMAANHCTELGYYAAGLELDARLAALRPDDPGILYNLACSMALVGNRDEALATLDKAVKSGYTDHRHMAKDRDLASLQGDSRFEEVVARAERMSVKRKKGKGKGKAG